MQKIPLILTRPSGKNTAFASQLPAGTGAHLTVVDAPLMRIERLEADPALGKEEAVIFTSANAVQFAPPPLGRRAYCVGQRTTSVAARAGWQAHCAGLDAAAAIAHLLATRPKAPLCHLSGVHVRGDVVETLSAAGLNARRVAIYDQILLPLPSGAAEVLSGGMPVIVPLFSPRAAAHFAAECPPGAQLLIASLSAAVMEALEDLPVISAEIAVEPHSGALIDCVEKLVRRIRLG